MTAAIVRGRRQDRERITAFDSLIDSPHDLGTSDLVMPASARLAISHSAALTLGQITISIVPGRLGFSHPAMAALATRASEAGRISHMSGNSFV